MIAPTVGGMPQRGVHQRNPRSNTAGIDRIDLAGECDHIKRVGQRGHVAIDLYRDGCMQSPGCRGHIAINLGRYRRVQRAGGSTHVALGRIAIRGMIAPTVSRIPERGVHQRDASSNTAGVDRVHLATKGHAVHSVGQGCYIHVDLGRYRCVQ